MAMGGGGVARGDSGSENIENLENVEGHIFEIIQLIIFLSNYLGMCTVLFHEFAAGRKSDFGSTELRGRQSELLA